MATKKKKIQSKLSHFEKHNEPLLPFSKFIIRIVRSFMFGLLIIMATLFIGMWGYHALENMAWIDAFVNAAMILSSMGPLGQLQTFYGKLFAGWYAIFCGIIFILTMGVIFSPLVHRFLHKFHLDE